MRRTHAEHQSEALRPTSPSRSPGLVLACLLLIPTTYIPASSADIYKHIGADGSVTYSDDSQDHSGTADTVLLALPASVVVPAPARTSTSNKPTRGSPAPREKETPFLGYQQLSINSPNNEETVRNNVGEVPINFQLSPPLQAGHSVQAIIDGRTIARWQQERTNIVLSNIERGSHQLRLEVFNAQEKMVGRSQTVTFYLHQNRAK